MSLARPKVLFFAEGATLAHVARPLVLARALDPGRFDVAFCRPPAFQWLTIDVRFPVLDLASRDGAVFASRLAHGRPLYDYSTLKRYVEEDLRLIDAEKPDLIIGDFRLSLSVSARLRSIPYITLCDAYWSPERALHAPLPVLGITRFAPLPVAEFVFRRVAGLALRAHAIPIERLRAFYGLPSLGFDLRRCYTDADLRLFANFPALFPDLELGANAAFIGPIAWSPEPDVDLGKLDTGIPLVYVTMGSSGDPGVLAKIIPALEQSGAQVMVATAGKSLAFEPASARTRIFDYLPGNTVCRHARLVVCNGGSPTTNQALACGVPVLGIARNMDQFLNMKSVEAFGAGILMRADRVSEGGVRNATGLLIEDPRFSERAHFLARSLAEGAPGIGDFVDRLLSSRHEKEKLSAREQ